MLEARLKSAERVDDLNRKLHLENQRLRQNNRGSSSYDERLN